MSPRSTTNPGRRSQKRYAPLAVSVFRCCLFVVLGCSSSQPVRDAVHAVEYDFGIPLDAGWVDVGDVELFVVQAGPRDGPPVLLLHGFPEFWYAWRGPMAWLADHGYRVIVPDQRGYGKSDKPIGVEPYAVERLADDMAELIEVLGHESAFVAGHDWGGAVAWELALRHPNKIRRLAVIGMPHPKAVREIREENTSEGGVSWYVIAFQLPWLPEQAVRMCNWRYLANTLRNSSRPGTFPEATLDFFRSAWDSDGAMTAMINWYRAAYRFPPTDPIDWLVEAPTLVVLAPDDRFMSAAMTRRSAKWSKAGTLIELDRGTHWVIHEEPEEIGRLLDEFFRKP